MRPDPPLHANGEPKPGSVGGPGFLPRLASRLPVRRGVSIAVAAGAVAGLVVIHPVAMAVYWFEFHPDIAGVSSLWQFLQYRVRAGFPAPMLAMSGLFALTGALLGGAGAFGLAALAWSERRIARLELELNRALPALLSAGEGETLEFKASVRWDYTARRVSRALEEPIVRTIAAFMNHRGGTLLLGVDDAGQVVGLAQDYATLHRQSRDGFEQYLTGLVRTALGAHRCALMHVVFHDVHGRDVCRVVVEPAPDPVFVERDGTAHYYVRTGNATRALDPREAMMHMNARRASA